MQLLDEVPMIWGSCYMLYCMHMVNIMLDSTFDETLRHYPMLSRFKRSQVP